MAISRLVIIPLTLLALHQNVLSMSGKRSFTIDYANDQWLKDGEPFRYIAGAMHYFRIPREYWRDRMSKMAASGLNAIQTYISWNMHEPQPGVFDFKGNHDFESYIRLAQEMGFVVILRIGPYIDCERDMGGLPFWLLQQNPNMRLRTKDPAYLKHVDRWLDILLPRVKRLLYATGGPVITVQVENEYGSYYACDFDYMHHLRDKVRLALGNETVLFTTDGGADYFLKCGKVDGLYATVDFGAGGDVKAAFRAQRNHEPHGPLVNSEFYPGWIDHWGYKHATVDASSVAVTLRQILEANASVTIYMFEGGTSFGFENGANLGDSFMPSPTSYDFDAPLNEAGDITHKYLVLRNVIRKFNPLPPGPIPKNLPKAAYGPIKFSKMGTIFTVLPTLCPLGPIRSVHPQSFEQIGQDYGFVLYRTTVVGTAPSYEHLLDLHSVRDHAHIYVNQKLNGVVSRINGNYFMGVSFKAGSNQLDILVENLGRICYGTLINDTKGLIDDVTMDGKVLLNWEIYSLPLNNTKLFQTQDTWNVQSSNDVQIIEKPAISSNKQHLHHEMENRWRSKHASMIHSNMQKHVPVMQERVQATDPSIASFYVADFVINTTEPADTFLKASGWYKGVAFVNGFNVGRYWPVAGPQVTLYIPAPLLLPAPKKNRLMLFELEWAPCQGDWGKHNCTMDFIDYPILDGAT